MPDTVMAVTEAMLARANAAVASGDRCVAHAAIEATNVIDEIMNTITPGDTLSWAGTWAWAAPAVQADGTIKHRIETTLDGIRAFYTGNRRRYQVMQNGPVHLRIASDWYAMIESEARFESVPDRSPYRQTWLFFSPMDGTEGITGEIAWGRFPQLEPGEHVTEEDRATLFGAYLAALRAADTDGVLAVMSKEVLGAVRNYAGGETFLPIDGAAAMRDYYTTLFSTMRIDAIDPIQFIDRGWYLFTELRWRVEFVSGPRAGQAGTLLTAEAMPLDRDGRIYARLGFGSELLAV